MKIRMLTSIAGPDWSAQPGDEIEIDDAEAARHIEAGHAEAVADDKPAPKSKAKD
jgi:hypothetical protein